MSEQGLPGERGLSGHDGLPGERGPTGDHGQTGDTGQTGSPGPGGERGPSGDLGHVGQQGLPGPPGPRGKSIPSWVTRRAVLAYAILAVGVALGIGYTYQTNQQGLARIEVQAATNCRTGNESIERTNNVTQKLRALLERAQAASANSTTSTPEQKLQAAEFYAVSIADLGSNLPLKSCPSLP